MKIRASILRPMAAAIAAGAVLGGAAVAGSILIENVTIIDGTGAAPQPGISVLIDGERIARIDDQQITAPEGATRIDGAGKFLIPGLIDTHVHLRGAADPNNADALMAEMMARGRAFWRGYNVERISKIILEEADPVAGLTALADKVNGAYSLVVLTRDGIYATRDVYGFRPLILGQRQGQYAVTSESRALQNLDFEVLRDVRPGEIILVNEKGFSTLKELPSPRRAHCPFEWAYTASIDSVIDGLHVLQARNNLGASLAQRDLEEGGLPAHLVAPAPMSGIGHAIGYHMHSRLNGTLYHIVVFQEPFLS